MLQGQRKPWTGQLGTPGHSGKERPSPFSGQGESKIVRMTKKKSVIIYNICFFHINLKSFIITTGNRLTTNSLRQSPSRGEFDQVYTHLLVKYWHHCSLNGKCWRIPAPTVPKARAPSKSSLHSTGIHTQANCKPDFSDANKSVCSSEINKKK